MSHLAAALGVTDCGAVGPFQRCPMGTREQDSHRGDSERRLCPMLGLDYEKLPASEVSDRTLKLFHICNQKIGPVGGAAHLDKGGGRDYQ